MEQPGPACLMGTGFGPRHPRHVATVWSLCGHVVGVWARESMASLQFRCVLRVPGQGALERLEYTVCLHVSVWVAQGWR